MLEIAVLGLLNESPMHGYEIRKRLATLLGTFRAFSYGSLYPTLRRLSEAGWIDEQGRVVATSQLGFELRRLPYEVAFENWRTDPSRVAVTNEQDILETTAIASNKRMSTRIDALRVRLSGVALGGFDLAPFLSDPDPLIRAAAQ